MKDQVSESVKLVYPLRLVLKVAGITSAAWYRKPKHGKEKARRGPRVVITDQALLDKVREEITRGHFIDEGLGSGINAEVSKSAKQESTGSCGRTTFSRSPVPNREERLMSIKVTSRLTCPTGCGEPTGKGSLPGRMVTCGGECIHLPLTDSIQPLSLCLCLVDGAPQRIFNNFLE